MSRTTDLLLADLEAARIVFLKACKAYEDAVSDERRSKGLSPCCGALTKFEILDGFTYCRQCGGLT